MLEIAIFKARRQLHAYRCGRVVLSCPIGLGPCPAGHKRAEGDGRTPEGEYRVCTRNDRSKYTLFLGLDYPGPGDAQAAYAQGAISELQLRSVLDAHAAGKRPPWNTPLGGQIGIHGGGIAQDDGLADSTVGCIALLDDDIHRLWEFAPIGTRVVVHP